MKLNIRNKLLLAFAAIIVLTGIVGYIGYDSANKINTMLNTMYENQLHGLMDVKNAQVEVYRLRVAVRDAVLSNDRQDIQTQVELGQQSETNFESYMADYEKTILSDDARQVFQQAMQDYRSYRSDADEVFSYADQGKTQQAVQVIRDGGPVVQKLDKSMNALITTKEKSGKRLLRAKRHPFRSVSQSGDWPDHLFCLDRSGRSLFNVALDIERCSSDGQSCGRNFRRRFGTKDFDHEQGRNGRYSGGPGSYDRVSAEYGRGRGETGQG